MPSSTRPCSSPRSQHVRISGVSVGKVVSVSLDRHTGLTKAVFQIDHQYAPRPADTHAILRQKSLLGETYIELSPGTENGPKLADGDDPAGARSLRRFSLIRSSRRSTR